MTRVILIANHRKKSIAAALAQFRPWLEQRAEIVAELDAYNSAPVQNQNIDFVIVMGGDGTMLAQARRIVDLEAPLIGINFGKLGFLAPFKLEHVQSDWDQIVSGKMPVRPRVMLQVQSSGTGSSISSLAMNDLVITAGPPFRMIQLELSINPEADSTVGTHFIGDGVIVSTPVGSTAYNLSAGGPIIAPDVDGLVITAICPQSLAFRPIVLNAQDRIVLRVHRANAGTSAVIDGQVAVPITAGSELTISAYPKRLRLMINPRTGYWKTLAKKMRWAAPPVYGDG